MACFTSSEEKVDLTDFSPVLLSVGQNVIYPTYSDLSDKAAALETAVLALDTTVNAGRLNTARAAWRAARAPWEESEGFLFGPVDTKSIDPSIDSWPLDSLSLKNILASSTPLTVDYVSGQVDEVKGFHAIEFLLFGVDSSKNRLNTRELAYAQSAASYFRLRVDLLKSSWNPAEGNFLGEFTGAGVTSTYYRSKKAAAEELLEGMLAICDEVANGKISEPFDHGSDKEESRFSRNSTTDFANNIRSVRNVYLGVYGSGSGPGVKAWVLVADSALALRAEAEMDSAISKTEQIGNFSAALSADRPKIAAARTAIQTLMTTLDTDVRKALFP